MGCCRTSIIYDPKGFFSGDLTEAKYFTSQETTKTNNKRSTIKINLRQKVNMTQGHLYQYYEIEDLLGEGAFGCVRKGIQIQTGNEVAIKSILKPFAQRDDDTHAIIEVEVLRTLDHPNILKVKELVEDTKYYHIITELCTGGELFEKILKLKPFSENQASKYMHQLLSGLAFCHKHGVLHRDIKPENLLFQSEQEDSPLKIIDFGVSNLNYSQDLVNVKQYTSIFYRAPEQFNGMCNKKSDLWSCGVILYLMLSGYLPFKGKNEKQMSQSISTEDLSFPDKEWVGISDEAKDLLRHMLDKNHISRYSAKKAFKHGWVQNGHSQYLFNRSVSEIGLVNLSKFRSTIRIRHAALEFIMSHFTHNAEVYELQQTFMAMDYNGDGKLSHEELTVACLLMNYSKNEVENILFECDANMNGCIDYTEFLTAASNWKKVMNKSRLKLVFDEFDLDKDGFISIFELKQMLGNDQVEDDVWEEIFGEVDSNQDGRIDFQEFEEAVLVKDTFRA